MVHLLLLLLLGLQAAGLSSAAAGAGGHGDGDSMVGAAPSSPDQNAAACYGLRVMQSKYSNSTRWSPLYHRHGPCSPFKSSVSDSDMLRRDQLRANDIRRKFSKNGSTTVLTTKGTSLGTMQYIITVGLGTPAVTQTVFIDTGSDLSWVQCKPCPVPELCHSQKDAFFDPGRSSTYSSFSCRSAACAQLGANYANGCSNTSVCEYTANYGDTSSTTGTYGSDRLTLTTSGVVSNFRFGCSHGEQGFTDQTDGIMGLGGDTQSLVSQTRNKVFSYCLPPTPNHSGFFTLGLRRTASSRRFVVTPMRRKKNQPTLYLVLLQAITVAGRRLDVPPSAFSAGSVMDSGTIITRLPPTAYHALRAAFRDEMKMYPAARPKSILDTCFNLTGFRNVKVPSVALVFDRGAAVELDPSGIMVLDCLAFTSIADDGDTGIIGNVQQRTLEVLYDVGGGAVGFRRRAC